MDDVLLTVRSTPDERLADEQALVLASSGVAHRLERADDGSGFRLVVRARDGERAERALAAWEADEAAPVEARDRVEALGGGSMWGGVILAAMLAAFHLLLYGRGVARAWTDAGAADSRAILTAGEWWRTVTALTLHADLGHVLGNAAAAVVFVGAAGRWLGPGLAVLLALVAGAAGNWLTAFAHGPGHHSIGASTATFAAVGLLGGLAFVRRQRLTPRHARGWVAVAAALGLLAMLGVGKERGIDVLAHGFGLAVGGMLGAVAGWLLRHRTKVPPAQWAFGVLALAGVLACWWRAWL